MRTIPPGDQTELAKQYGAEPILVLKIVWSGGDTKYYATKGLGTEDGSTAANAIGSMMSIENFSEQITVGSAGSINNISVSLIGIRSYYDSNALQGKVCTVYQYFLASGSLTTGTTMFVGKIASPITWAEDSDLLSFDVISHVPESEIGFALDRNGSYSYTPDDAAFDKMWPIIFGTCRDVPALQIQKSIVGKLTEQLNVDTTSVDVEGGEEFTQSTAMSVLFGVVACQGSFSDKEFTFTSINDARYTSISLASRPGGDTDEDNYAVLWLTGNLTVKGSYCYDSTLGQANFCYKQQTSGSNTKCWFRSKWGSWSDGVWTDAYPSTGINEIAGAIRPSWNQASYNYIHSFTVKADAPVLRLDTGGVVHADSQVLYVGSYVWASLKAVKAYRTVDGEKVLCNVPSSYYTEGGDSGKGSGVSSRIITMDLPLSKRDKEGWDDQLYCSYQISSLKNTADAIEEIITTWTSLTIDSSTFASVKTALTNYPSNFVVLSQSDALRLCENIAWQARCALRIVNNVVYIIYLSIEPLPTINVTDDDFEIMTTLLSLTDETDLITKFTANWKDSYAAEAKLQTHVLKENVSAYGLTQSEYDFNIFNVSEWVEKSATFWAHRYANIWKLVSFDSFLENMELQALDPVTLTTTAHGIVSSSVTGIVQNISIAQQDGKVRLDLWLPVISGTQTKDANAWLTDGGDSLIDVDISDLRLYDYEIEIEHSDEEDRNSSFEQQAIANAVQKTMLNKVIVGQLIEDLQPDTVIRCSVTSSWNEPEWNDGRTPGYIIGEGCTYNGDPYLAKTNHNPTQGNKPAPGGNSTWQDLLDFDVEFPYADPTAYLNAMEQPLLTGLMIPISWVGDAWVGFDLVSPKPFYEEIYAFKCTEVATAATNLTCKSIWFDNASAWANGTYIPKYSFRIASSRLFEATIPHDSVTALNHPITGSQGSYYWVEHTTVEVYFSIKGVTNLEDLSEPLAINDIVYAKYDGSQWNCIQTLYEGGSGAGVLHGKITQAVTLAGYSVYKFKIYEDDGTTPGAELTATYPMGHESRGTNGENWRNWHYQWKVNDIVTVAQHWDTHSTAQLRWFITSQTAYLGTAAQQSVAVNEDEDNRLMCVIK